MPSRGYNAFDAADVNQFSERRVDTPPLMFSHLESFSPRGRFRAQKQRGGLVLRKAAAGSPPSAGARKGCLLDGGVELDQRPETAVGEGQAEGGGGGIQLVLSPRGEG